MTVPRCVRCGRPHLASLPCWRGDYSRRLVRLTLATYGTVCWLCGSDGATTADHVLPRSRGGSDAIENLRPAHTSCNSSRGNRLQPRQSRRPASNDAGSFLSREAPQPSRRPLPFSPGTGSIGPTPTTHETKEHTGDHA